MGAACRRHCSLNELLLTHSDPITFVICQWQPNKKTPDKPYVIYRVFFACVFLVISIVDVIDFEFLEESAEYKAKWLIFLTHWGFTTCTFQAIASAVMISVSSAIPRLQEKALKFYKVYWASHTIATDVAFGITIIYWTFLYDAETMELTAMDLLTHGLNSVLMMTDLFVVSHPVRLLHFCYPLVFGIFYIVFSVIYYVAGGTDKKGNSYIYTILDWNKPGTSTVVCIGVMGLLVVLHVITWGVYKARERLHQRLFKPREEQEQP